MVSWGYILGACGMAAKGIALLMCFRRPWREFLCVKIWFALLLLEDLAILSMYAKKGSGSLFYAQTYYWIDLVVIVFGFLVLLRLAEIAFASSKLPVPLLRGSAIAILAGIAGLSLIAVFGHLMTNAPAGLPQLMALANALEQNVGVAGMLASILLWISVNVLAVPGVRLRRLIAGFGIFYSASGGSFALVQLFGVRYGLAVQFFSVFSIILLGYALVASNEALPESAQSLALESAFQKA